MTNTTESKRPPTHDEIAAYAYHLWEADGRKEGRDAEYWHQARTQLASQPAQPSQAQSPARESNGAANGNKQENNKKRKQEAPPAARRQPAFATA